MRGLGDFLVAGAVLVEIAGVRGSSPREAGAWMLVSGDGILGTVGGGQLEWMAIDASRGMARKGEAERVLDIPLGPQIGQCCGGWVRLRLRAVDEAVAGEVRRRVAAEAAARPEVLVFGAGHVGRGLAAALAPAPVRVTVIDVRPELLEGLPAGVAARAAAIPEAAVRAAPGGSAFVVVTHDHALDFLVTREALLRGDAAYVGMIGSSTKRARFRRWFREEGGDEGTLARLVCPIGASRLGDKRPEVIAALAAAEILVHTLGRRERDMAGGVADDAKAGAD